MTVLGGRGTHRVSGRGRRAVGYVCKPSSVRRAPYSERFTAIERISCAPFSSDKRCIKKPPKQEYADKSASIEGTPCPGRFAIIRIISGAIFSGNNRNLEERPEEAKKKHGLALEDAPSSRASKIVTRDCNSSTFFSREMMRAVQPLVVFLTFAPASKRNELRVLEYWCSRTFRKKFAMFFTPKTVKIV
ncbi:hypothetical protein LguiB_009521 [Lonicera macranthoides]